MTAYEQQYDVYLKEIQAALENACNTYLPEDSRVCQAAAFPGRLARLTAGIRCPLRIVSVTGCPCITPFCIEISEGRENRF